MEEEVDIYDFPEETISNEKCEDCEKLQTKLSILKSQFEKTEKVSKILHDNYTSLLFTAKGEVARKDRMIEDLRRQLNDKAFRRGNYRHVAQVPTPQTANESSVQIPIPPKNSQIIKNEVLQTESVDVSEYACNSEPYIDDEEDVLQKYEPSRIFETVYSQRLRKKLEEEKLLAIQEKEKEKEKKTESEQSLVESEKISVPGERECNIKCNIDNKENLSSSNQLERPSTTILQSAPNEESTKNRLALISKSAIKRSASLSYEDSDASIKRIKTETGYNDFRENWGLDNETEQKAMQNQKSETCNFNSNINYSKVSERNDKFDRQIEDSSQNPLALRLKYISQSVSTAMEKRRDWTKRDRDSEKERHEPDYCKNKYDRDKHDSERHCDKYEKDRDSRERDRARDRDHRDKYKDRFESKRYERDYRNERPEKRRYDNHGKFAEKYEKDPRIGRYNKRTRRSESPNPRRGYPRQRESRRDFKDNLGQRNQKVIANEEPDWRKKLERPNEKESQMIIEDFNSRRQRNGNFAGRSKSCSERTRSRSRGREPKIIDPSKKISLENYRARKGDSRGNSSEKIKLKSEEKDKEDLARNKTTSAEKDSKSECIPETKINSRESGERNIETDPEKKISNIETDSEKAKISDIVETDSEKKNTRLTNIAEELEDGEISPLKEQFTEEEKTRKSVTLNVPGVTDTQQKKCANTNKISSEKGKIEKIQEKETTEKLQEKGNKIEREQEKGNKVKQLQERESKTEKSQERENKIEKLQEKGNKIQKVQNKFEKTLEENESGKEISANKINNKTVTADSNKGAKIPVEKKSRRNSTKNNPVSEIKPSESHKNEFPESDKNSHPQLVQDILGEILNTTFDKHVQNLDSFIESAEKVLEEKKEGYSADQISREVVNELREELKIPISVETNKIKNVPKLQENSNPVKNKKKSKTTESKETEIANSAKEGKNHLKSKEDEKNDSSAAKEKEAKITENLKNKISSPAKEKTTENSKQKISNQAEEKIVNSAKEGEKSQQLKSKEEGKMDSNTAQENQGKTENSKPKISSPAREKKIENENERSKNVSNPPEESCSSEVKNKSATVINSNSKETKKQTKKVKQEIKDTKTKTKKSNDKLKGKIIVNLKRRRPIILTDVNASGTIVAKEGGITNIKLNTSGEKNNLLS